MKKKQLSIALAAAFFAAGASGALAAGTSHLATSKTAKPGVSTLMAKPGVNDTLSLASTQQKTAWNDLKGQASNQPAPAGLQTTIGSIVPASVMLAPVPSKAASDVPMLKPYDFAMVSGKLLIVNPSDRKIAEVITG